MEKLHTLKCRACEGLEDKLGEKDIKTYMEMLTDWNLLEDKIEKNFECKDFNEVMQFVNKVAVLAEEEGHHPDLFIHGWNKLTITVSTHALNGLSINDFILASKIDRIK